MPSWVPTCPTGSTACPPLPLPRSASFIHQRSSTPGDNGCALLQPQPAAVRTRTASCPQLLGLQPAAAAVVAPGSPAVVAGGGTHADDTLVVPCSALLPAELAGAPQCSASDAAEAQERDELESSLQWLQDADHQVRGVLQAAPGCSRLLQAAPGCFVLADRHTHTHTYTHTHTLSLFPCPHAATYVLAERSAADGAQRARHAAAPHCCCCCDGGYDACARWSSSGSSRHCFNACCLHAAASGTCRATCCCSEQRVPCILLS